MCRKRIDPDAPDTVRAVEMQKTVAMGPTVEWVEGMGVFFHDRCLPDRLAALSAETGARRFLTPPLTARYVAPEPREGLLL